MHSLRIETTIIILFLFIFYIHKIFIINSFVQVLDNCVVKWIEISVNINFY